MVDHVQVELWAPQQSLELGRPVSATGRVTNLSPRAIWYEGEPCALPLNGLVRFPAFDSPGRSLEGVAARVKRAWARGDGSPLDRYTRPGANAFFGTGDTACDHEEEQMPPMSHLDPGQSLALTLSGVPNWDEGPFPDTAAVLGVIFTFGSSEHYGGAEGRVAYASLPVSVKGGVPTLSPAATLDAAFTADGVPAYLAAHADSTQLTADPRLSAGRWTVDVQAIDIGVGRKAVAPALEIAIDRTNGRVLSVRSRGQLVASGPPPS
jgi:hypothetical protein